MSHSSSLPLLDSEDGDKYVEELQLFLSQLVLDPEKEQIASEIEGKLSVPLFGWVI